MERERVSLETEKRWRRRFKIRLLTRLDEIIPQSLSFCVWASCKGTRPIAISSDSFLRHDRKKPKRHLCRYPGGVIEFYVKIFILSKTNLVLHEKYYRKIHIFDGSFW